MFSVTKFNFDQLTRRKETWLSILIEVLIMFYVCVEGNTWYIAICVISPISIVFVCVYSVSLPVESQVRKQQLHSRA